MPRHIPRFFLKNESAAAKDMFLMISTDQIHHAVGVLRLKTEDEVRIFNGSIGEWRCEISDVKKRLVKCIEQIKKAEISSKKSFSIAFSLINPAKMSFLIEKITELGVNEIIPIISQYTQQRRFNREKAEQVAIGACEQSGRLEPPKIGEVQTLEELLKKFTKESQNQHPKTLFVADEVLKNHTPPALFSAMKTAKSPTFLIGPEGGFSNSERDLFEKYEEYVQRISLGPNILRSETAAIAVAAVAGSPFSFDL